MTTDKDIEALRADLVSWRMTVAGARNKARSVYAAVLELAKFEVLLPAERTLNYLAHNIYFNSGYDARMNYSSVEEFSTELVNDLREKWPTEREVDGKQYYVTRPLFDNNPSDLDTQLGWSLRGCKLSELSALNVAPLDEAGMHAGVTGLSKAEFEVLISMHRSEVTAIVNKIRWLDTALQYPVNFFKRIDNTSFKRELSPVMPDEMLERILSLKNEIQLPGTFPPPPHFGSDWDAQGKVKNLELDSDLVAYFRTWA